jgi:hypothetical protein
MFAARVYNKKKHPQTNITLSQVPLASLIFMGIVTMIFGSFVPVSITQIFFQNSSVALELGTPDQIFFCRYK